MSMVWTRDNALTTGNTSFGIIAELRFRVLSFRIVAPEATHGASFEEHSCADARTIVQGKALNVKDYISSVHYDTVRGEPITSDADVPASAECDGKKASFPSMLRVNLSCPYYLIFP